MAENSGLTGLEIAVIGMSGRFPGARNIDEFWENLKNGVESLRFYSDEELLKAGVDQVLLENPDYVKSGGGELEDVEYFDALFFGYSPSEATVMDPQVRIFHECVWEALEQAGYDPSAYKGKIGLYAGASSSTSWENLVVVSGKADEVGRFTAVSLANSNFLCTRIAYKLDLKGPVYAVQTACSTSLTAIDLACRGILTGQCNMALAGGTSVKGLREVRGYLFKEGMIRSPDGHCRAFDAKAKGTVGGEGVGVVVLKLLEEALADRDTIHAVIKGSASNNDGSRKVGYTAPSVEGQAEVIRAAHLAAEIDPESITYVETHGTGTPLGDPVEIEALKQGFGTNKKGFCLIGSVKTNVGHLDTAAGVTGFIKTVLALKHRQIPPSLHFETPNPKIDFENTPFQVNTSLKEWKRGDYPRRAGVSAFGIGGTNAHVVLEEWIENTSGGQGALFEKTAPWTPAKTFYYLLLLSARTETALDKMTANLAVYLKNNPNIDLTDVAYTLQMGRKAFRRRRMLVCRDIDGTVETLANPGSVEVLSFSANEKSPSVFFLFPGQGSQYVNMGLGLYEQEHVFRQEMDRCFEILKLLIDYDLKGILYPSLGGGGDSPNKSSRSYESNIINETQITQPVIFIIEYALAKLLMSWGIKPNAMIGHSIGEYTAACLSGVFSLEIALKIVTLRGKLMQQVPPGVMTGVSISEEQLRPLLKANPALSPAAINSPSNCTVSGTRQAVEDFERQAKEIGYRLRPLHTSHAFHSDMMNPILKPFEEVFRQIPLNKPGIPYLSNITGDWISGEQTLDPTYWSNHLRKTVRFSDGLKELLKIENTVFIEVGPGRVLSTFVKEHDPSKTGRQLINLVRHPQEETADVYFLYREIGKLWLYGKEIDWRAFGRGEKGRRVPLPVYPFERELYRIERNAGAVSGQPGGLADRFYLPQWKRTVPVYNNQAPPVADGEKNFWLVFMDRVGLGALLVKRLEARGDDVVTVTAGETVHPQNPEDYLRLFQTLSTSGKIPDRILHLWTLTGPERPAEENFFEQHFEETQVLGFYSLLNIAKAIRQIAPGSGQRFRIIVISDDWRDVTGEEEIDPAKATMAGPLAVIPQEHPNIRCRGIDIVYSTLHLVQQEEDLADRIVEEALNDSGGATVAFRGPYRLTQEFEPLRLAGVKREQLPLREKGVYLITGGLGKIGFALAGYLARDYKARLILTGRSDGQGAEKAKKVEELEALGAEVMVFSADAGDLDRMQEVAAAAEERWGVINGVIHAAGIVKGTTFDTIDNLQPEDCRLQFRAKVFGTRVLEELFQDKNPDFCVLISSISTILGGLQFAAYAGANAFMDAFVSRTKRRGNLRWFSVDWDSMPVRETIEAFKRIFALPVSQVSRMVVSSRGNLQARLDRWIKLESLEEETAAAGTETAGQHPRPQLFTPYMTPMGNVQEVIAETWQRIFGFDRIGVRDDFLELGGDSLKAVTVISVIHKQLNVEIPLPVFFTSPTIEKLAEYIESTKTVNKNSYSTITPVEKKEYYSLSSAQKRLYFLQQLDLNSISYNMPLVYPLQKEIDKEKLEFTLKHLIARHESFRTSFIVVCGEVVQQIHQNVDFNIECYDLAAEDAKTGEEKIKVFGSPETIFQKGFWPPEAFIRPFDLSRAPLIRSGLMRLSGGHCLWLLDMHHIVSDGTSHTILTEDFSALYADAVLEPLPLQYKDYAQWQNRMLEGGKIKTQEDYWMKLYTGEIPRLNMPTDTKRPAVFTFAGDRFGFILGPEDATGFKALGAAAGGTLYMNLLAALNTLFFKYTGQSDIIIGCGIAGRPHADLQRIMGMFINTLAMRNYPGGEKTYQSFLKEVIAQSIQAFENQDVPFEELVDRLALERDLSRNPLFDISMVLQNFRQVKVRPAAAEVVPNREALYRNPTSKFDMTIFVQERSEDVHIVIEYYTVIFKLSTIQRFAAHFTNVIKAVTLEPGSSLKDIEILTAEEKSQVLYEFNDTTREFPAGITLHGLFEEQVERAAGATALVHEDRMISYGDLNARANRLARYLYREKGLKSGDRVGIWMSPSLERVTAILGVLKAGAGYVPIDSDLPVGRIKYMLKDAVIGVVLSEKKYIRDLERLQWECSEYHSFLCMDSLFVYGETEIERNELMDEELWRHVGETAVDDITAGGWLSSYTGEPFSREEMDEYGDNILNKLEPLLHPGMRVLEIGCASGISMYRIAHRVGFYYGTDLSAAVIDREKKKLAQMGSQNLSQNIMFSCLEAHDIDWIREKDFDLVIMNSVIQCFYGYNYLRQVIEKSIKLLGERGYLFIGDVMDLEKKNALVQELMEFKRSNRGKGYTTKTDFSAELFVSRGFWKDLQSELSGIEVVEFSPKLYTIENELTKFRYDVLLKINKQMPTKGTAGKVKFQQDLRMLEGVEESPLSLPIESCNPAYIIYTSGTTGRPKGVMIEHMSLVNFIFSMYRDYCEDFGQADHCLGLTNFCFDVSVCEIFMPLVFGASIVFPAYEKVFDPALVAEVIIKKSITFSYIPPGLLQEVVDYLGIRLQGLGSGLELNKMLVGVEPIKDDVLEAYLKLNPAMKIINGYGPTEATICAAAYRYESREPGGNRVPIGRPLANMGVVLLDNYQQMVPVGVPGELCISGVGLSRGYLNHPELTAEKFDHNLLDYPDYQDEKNKSFYGGARGAVFSKKAPLVYHTGDLARWLPDGNLMFIGRIDHQVKVRGFRIELGEIESVLQKHEAVRAAVVTADQGGYLCAYYLADRDVLVSQLKEYLAASLPDYMIPSYFIQLEKLPLTPNGKVDRKALPVPGFKAGEDYVAPTGEIEKKLTAIWSEILGIKEDAISIDAGFFNLGGHSLKATRMVSMIHRAIEVKIPLVEIFKLKTIRELSKYIKGAKNITFEDIEPVEKMEYYPLSSAQKRLYILHQMEPDSINYNMTQVVPLAGVIDLQGLESVFQELIARHESLRTSFEMIANEPVQRIRDEVEFEIDKSFAPPGGGTLKKFIRPFDLSCAPLFRVGFKEEKGRGSILLVDMHHIITDGVSQAVLKEEFAALYKGLDLPPLKLQYKDYSQWQNSEERQVMIKQQEIYWLREFSGELPTLHLPIDFPRPTVQSFEGSTVGFVVEAAGTLALKKLTVDAKASLFMVILAVFNVLLSKLSGQEDIIVGTPVAARRHADLERIIGMFVNTLPLRNYPSGEKPFKVFLKEVKEGTLEAFENQESQFEDLVEKLFVPRDTGRNPVFDVMFNLLNQEDYPATAPAALPGSTGAGGDTYRHRKSAAKFDMTLTGVELGEHLFFSFEYCTRLFEPKTIDRMVGYFKHLLELLSLDPDRRLAAIEIITDRERERILFELNDTASPYPMKKTIHQLFEEQVEKYPDNIAVFSHGQTRTNTDNICVTYRELNEKSNYLAGLLIEKGVLADSIVGIMMERSVKMVIGIYGILKAGGAYLPIDSDYPRERINYILKDSGTRILINKKFFSEYILAGAVFQKSSPVNSNLAYIIYTSGSTGRPKGVMIEHRSVVNVLSALFRQYPFDGTDCFLMKTLYTFDVSVAELFGWSWGGGRLALLGTGDEKDPEQIIDAIERFWVTYIDFVPSMFGILIEVLKNRGIKKIVSLKYIFLAGEALSPSLVRHFRELNSSVRLENLYGPTEGTVYTSGYSLAHWAGGVNVPIGKPLQNVRLYILDKYGRLQPIGIAGELCIGGDGLARGYLNNSELTAERFNRSYRSNKTNILYKTGDLARWLPDGNIMFVGRIDHQVKVRGFRIELGEIESVLQKHEAVRAAVVTAKEGGYLCAYITVDKEVRVSQLKEYLAASLPDCMIPLYFIQLEKMPLTPNGKVDRKALPDPDFKAGEEYALPSGEIEKKLTAIWSEILDIKEDVISADAGFFNLGGHSLKATRMVSMIHRALEVKIPLVEIFKLKTIRELAKYINGAERTSFEDIEPEEKREYYVLSYNQEWLWGIYRQDPQNSAYNMSGGVAWTSRVDPALVEESLRTVMEKHESLRTGFVEIGGKPFQFVVDSPGVPLELVDISSLPEAERERKRRMIYEKEENTPFDLTQPPLFRAVLVKWADEGWDFIYNIHHIVSDGWSLQVLRKDFLAVHRALLSGAEAPNDPLPTQYKDFTAWQLRLANDPYIKENSGRYWREKLDAGIPVIPLPVDFPGEENIRDRRGAGYRCMIGAELKDRLRETAEQHSTTLFTVMTSVFLFLFSGLSKREEIACILVNSGRQHVSLYPSIGFFATPVLFKTHVPAGEPFMYFLDRIHREALEVFHHMISPPKLALEQPDLENPDIPIVFNMLNMQEHSTGMELEPFEPVQIPEAHEVKFDLEAYVSEYSSGIEIYWAYRKSLFKPETIAEIAAKFTSFLEYFVANPGMSLNRFPANEKN